MTAQGERKRVKKDPNEIIAVEDTYLTNIKPGRRRPDGPMWEAHLFCLRRDGRRTVVSFAASSRNDRDGLIVMFTSGKRLV